MKTNNSRRSTIKKIAGSAAAFTAVSLLSENILASDKALGPVLKGRINQSVCKWCFSDISLDDLCIASKKMGIKSIELLGINDWPVLKKHGLTCALGWPDNVGIEEGFNNPANHDKLVASFTDCIPKAAKAGVPNLIAFSGNRKGMDEKVGLENCVTGIKRIIKLAEEHKVVITMELLNSHDHKDYMCDHTAWGVELVKRINSPYFKLLYDIYHMQIMEGNVIETIKNNHQYFSHYHTAGVPGRNEIDDTQELQYPAIMRAIADTGYKGFVAQEFIPKRADKIASLEQAVKICDV